MKILSIETSCDETAITLLEASGPLEKPVFKILANSMLSQMHLHADYGGVYPNLAKREHEKNLPPLLEKTLVEAGENLDSPDIDFIAVTEGPGLEPALWTGITFAEKLGDRWNKPVVPINHMEGHVFSVLYKDAESFKLPAIALLVSGGHTELVHIKDFGVYEVIGKTRDDAVGEAFDKVGRLLNLPYPGGPKVSQLAEIHRQKGLEAKFEFPRPMINSGDLDFSYSGLKTAVLYKLEEFKEIDENVREEVSRAFEDAAIEVLISKTRKAFETYPGIKTLILGGGVSANNYLRSEISLLSQELTLDLFLPEKDLSTDNAVMIGIAAYLKVTKDPRILETRGPIRAQGNLSITSSLR
jgi:N6-L-threonylcarbamoyladenine synthase